MTINRAEGSPDVWQILDGPYYVYPQHTKEGKYGTPRRKMGRALILVHANCSKTSFGAEGSWTRRDGDGLCCTRCQTAVPEKMVTCAVLVDAHFQKEYPATRSMLLDLGGGEATKEGPVIVTTGAKVVWEIIS